jgi:chorismate lyase
MMNTPPPGLQTWLHYPTSITDKLKSYHPKVTLTLIEEVWTTPDKWEASFVSETSIFRREILMCAGNHACWYARTMIPESTYHPESARFARLKTEPLGQIIWHASDIQRKNFLHFSMESTDALYQYLQSFPQLKLGDSTLWGRLSTFMIKDRLPFYLLEIFLPELKHYYDHTQ